MEKVDHAGEYRNILIFSAEVVTKGNAYNVHFIHKQNDP